MLNKEFTKEQKEKILKSSFCKTDKKFWEMAMAKVEDLEGEEWRPFRNTMYSVSNFGRVKHDRGEMFYPDGKYRFFEEKLLKQFLRFNRKTKRWEYVIVLMIDGKRKHFYVSRLVAECFVPNDNPEHKKQVNHKNENPLDNRATNLEWCTSFYNNNYGTRTERMKKTIQLKKQRKLKTA